MIKPVEGMHVAVGFLSCCDKSSADNNNVYAQLHPGCVVVTKGKSIGR